jgi:hypothetical protein
MLKLLCWHDQVLVLAAFLMQGYKKLCCLYRRFAGKSRLQHGTAAMAHTAAV